MNQAHKLLNSIGAPISNEPKRPPPKVGIVIPSGDEVKANFAMALAAMTYQMGIPLALFNEKGSNIAVNRNNGIDHCIQYGMDWCLQIDSDITFPADAVLRLLKHAIANRLEVIGGTYARRTQPHNNLAVPLGRTTSSDVAGCAEVEALPTGFLLIKLSALENLKRPYFRFPTMEEGEEPPEPFKHVIPHDGKPRILGEDYYFCMAAKAAGISVWLDVDLSFELKHWGEIGYQLVEKTEQNPHGFAYVELQSAHAT